MKLLRIPIILLLCFSLAVPVFAQEVPRDGARLYLVTQGMPTQECLATAQLAAAEFAAEGYAYALVYGTQRNVRKGDILILCSGAIAAQGYQISVDEENVRILYSDTDGLLYGMRAVLKMLLCGEVYSLTDTPDTKERTLMIDCARKYFSKEFICNLIRQMSWMGFNALELHLTEEQGIRADIWDAAYFTSENDYSWICGSETAYWVYDCPDPDAGKYLTAAELVEILAVAQQYHVEIIPSFNTPGHSEYLCNTYADHMRENPEYSFLFEGRSYTTDSIAANVYSAIDVSNEAACAFVRSVLLDYAKFFAAYGCTKFNLCADEISLDDGWASWDKTAYDVVIEYINDTADALQALGYRVRAFNDFLCYSYANVALDEEIEIVYWHTPYASAAADAETFLQDGRTLYNAIQNYCYYALRVFNTPGYSDRLSWGLDARDENNFWWAFHRATPERVYAEWNPTHLYEYTDSVQTVLENEQLGGSYFLIWCDYAGLATEEEIWSGEYPLLERLWAHSAKSWNWNPALSYEAFAAQIQNYYEYPGFISCTQPPELTFPSRPAYAGSLSTVTAIEEFRHMDFQTSEEAYWELLRTQEYPYGAFGGKRS